MNSGVIICAIICGTIIALAIIGCFYKQKSRSEPKDIKYNCISTTETTLMTVLTGIAKSGKKIVGVTLDYKMVDQVRYLIIYEEPVDE